MGPQSEIELQDILFGFGLLLFEVRDRLARLSGFGIFRLSFVLMMSLDIEKDIVMKPVMMKIPRSNVNWFLFEVFIFLVLGLLDLLFSVDFIFTLFMLSNSKRFI